MVFHSIPDTLPTLKLDLLKFSFCIEKLDSFQVNKLCRFMETQVNLQEIVISATLRNIFFDRFQRTLSKLVNLKVLNLDFCTSQFGSAIRKNSQYWRLGNLEAIRIHCENGLNNILLDNIFRFSSNKLKEIKLEGANDYGGEIFMKISKNYHSLIKLDIGFSGENYSSNEIFLIMKHSKKLRCLNFKFPSESALNAAKFNGSDNFMLPEIEEVHFQLNDSITNEHLLQFLLLLKNLNKFTIQNWSKFNQTTLEIISKELPNLSKLQVNDSDLPSTLQDLEILNDNIARYNLRPREFQLNDKMIQTHIREANEKAKREGGSSSQA